jgi:hypothetical protein
LSVILKWLEEVISGRAVIISSRSFSVASFETVSASGVAPDFQMGFWMGYGFGEKESGGELGMDQQGPKARLMTAWGNAPGTMHRWIFSANGAAYLGDERLHNGLGRAFSPWWLLRAIS